MFYPRLALSRIFREQNRTIQNATAAGIVVTCHVSPPRNRSMKALVLLSVLLGFSAPTFAVEIALVNPGFEMPMKAGEIPGWNQMQHAGALAYEMTTDTKQFHGGKHSFRMYRTIAQVYGSLEQKVSAAKLIGKTVELSAQLRTADVGKKGWRLILNFMSADGNSIAQKKSELMIGTSKKWQTISLQDKVPVATTWISVSVVLLDEGTGWLDDVRLRTVDK
jgi:hypothetical protein